MMSQSTSNDKKSTVFVGGLAFHITEADLMSHFSFFGAVNKIVLLRDRNTGQSKGYAFVMLEEQATADLILAQTNIICGRRVECQQAAKKNEKVKVDEERRRKKVYVSRIPSHLSSSEFERLFAKHGQVHNCYIIQDVTSGANKPYGFIEFENAEDADRLLALANDKGVTINGCRLSIQPFKYRLEQKESKEIEEAAQSKNAGSAFDFLQYFKENYLSNAIQVDQEAAPWSWGPIRIKNCPASSNLKTAADVSCKVTNYRFNKEPQPALNQPGSSTNSSYDDAWPKLHNNKASKKLGTAKTSLKPHTNNSGSQPW